MYLVLVFCVPRGCQQGSHRDVRCHPDLAPIHMGQTAHRLLLSHGQGNAHGHTSLPRWWEVSPVWPGGWGQSCQVSSGDESWGENPRSLVLCACWVPCTQVQTHTQQAAPGLSDKFHFSSEWR